MNDLIHADIFFIITSVVTVILGILAAIALYYIVGILRNIRDITDRAERGSEVLEHDLEHLRERVKEDGVRFRHIKKFLKGYSRWFPSDEE